MKLGQIGPFEMPSRTSIPWCMSAGRNVSESHGSASNTQEYANLKTQHKLPWTRIEMKSSFIYLFKQCENLLADSIEAGKTTDTNFSQAIYIS